MLLLKSIRRLVDSCAFCNGTVMLVTSLAIIHACFFIASLHSGHIYLADDSQEYLRQAYNLKYFHSWYGGDFSKPYDAYLQTRRAPFYGAFLFAVKSIYDSDYFVLIVQNLLSIFNFVVAFSIIGKLGRKINVALLIIPILFFPTQFIYANRIMADVLFQAFLVLAIYFFISLFTDGKPGNIFFFSLMIALALLTKPVLYLFWIVVAAVVFLLWKKKIINAWQTAAASIPALAVVGLSFYNYSVTGYFHFSSGNNMMVYHYYSTSYRFSGDDSDLAKSDSVTMEARNGHSLKQFSATMQNSFFEIVKEHPVKVTLLQIFGMGQFFLDHGRWDVYSFFVQEIYTPEFSWRKAYNKNGLSGIFQYVLNLGILPAAYFLAVLVINCILMAGFIASLYDTHLNSWYRSMIFILVFYLVLLTGMVGASRYRMAIYPFLLIATAIRIADKTQQVKYGK